MLVVIGRCFKALLRFLLRFPLSAFFQKGSCLEAGLCEGGSFVNFKENGFKDFKIVVVFCLCL